MAPFFFSYAHNDALDDHLDKFYDEVNKRVRYLTGAKADGFRDSKKLRAGDEWSKELAEELSVSPSIVCLYSPSYFQSKVCAQELQVFLDRRQKYMQLNPGKRPGNIIPVLWQPWDIPRTLPAFQYEKPRSKDLEKEGVWAVRDRRKVAEFNLIAQSVAVRLKEAYKSPLPEPGYKPVLGGVGSAFEPPPLPPNEFDHDDQAAGPQCATFVYPRTEEWKEWPFFPHDEPLLRISGAVTKGRDLHLRQLTFDPSAGSMLDRFSAARRQNNLIILLVSATQLKDPALVARFKECDDEGLDVLSTLVVWPSGSRDAEAQRMVKQAFPKASERQPPFFYPDLDQPEKFADALGESLDALKMSIIRNLQGVQGLQTRTEFSTMPSVSGPGGRRVDR